MNSNITPNKNESIMNMGTDFSNNVAVVYICGSNLI